MKPVVHTLGWFSDLIDIFKNSEAKATTKISNSTSETTIFNKIFDNLGTGFNDTLEMIKQIGEGLDLLTQSLGQGLSDIYAHLRELDQSILETRQIVETNRVAIFCCIGLLILFFIIAMVRIGKLKEENHELKYDVKTLNDKVDSLISEIRLLSAITAYRKTGTPATKKAIQNNTESSATNKENESPDNSVDLDGLPYDNHEELKKQLNKKTEEEESDSIMVPLIIGFIIFFVFVIIIGLLASSGK